MGTTRSRIYMPYSYYYVRTGSRKRLYGSLPPTIWPKMGEYKQCPRVGFKTRNPKKRRTRHYRYPWKRSKRRRPPRSRSDGGPNDPESLRALRGKDEATGGEGEKGKDEHEGEKKDPFCPLPLYKPQMSAGSTAPRSGSTGPVATRWLRAVLPLQKQR